jgi:protein-S-isoprenylcysteine O-methyltransferase Ste14
MAKRDLQRSMYELRDASVPQRFVLAGIAAIWVALAWWLLAGDGLTVLSGWLVRDWEPGDPVRRLCLAVGFSIYYVRILFTEFLFLKRGVSWSEVFTIASWLLIIVLLLGIEGGTNGAALGAAGVAGAILFIAGSWMNSYAEYARHVWKQRPENHGRLYTGGLFRYSRHPNYLGDLLLFSGLCLISGAWVTVVIPLLMLGGFVFVNIPVLDSHLHDHYGATFADYARRTRKLIPLVY